MEGFLTRGWELILLGAAAPYKLVRPRQLGLANTATRR